MVAIALVDVDAARLDTEELGHVGDGRAERVAIEGIAVLNRSTGACDGLEHRIVTVAQPGITSSSAGGGSAAAARFMVSVARRCV
jgi:hypothetical protein